MLVVSDDNKEEEDDDDDNSDAEDTDPDPNHDLLSVSQCKYRTCLLPRPQYFVTNNWQNIYANFIEEKVLILDHIV